MKLEKSLKQNREEILRIGAQRGARNVRVPRWAAQQATGPDCEIDFIVEFGPGWSLLDHTDLVRDLQNLLGYTVDIMAEQGMPWYVRERVLDDAVLP